MHAEASQFGNGIADAEYRGFLGMDTKLTGSEIQKKPTSWYG